MKQLPPLSTYTRPQELFHALPGTFGLLAALPHAACPLAAYNEEKSFPAASVIKLPLLVEVYRQALMGTVVLTDTIRVSEEFHTDGSGILTTLSDKVTMTVRDLASLMMQLSDNTAANTLLAVVGRDSVNRTMAALGFEQTILHQDRFAPDALETPEALATTTARDMVGLLLALAQESILTPAACREVLELMKRNSNKQRICGQLPFRPDIEISHKTGSLKGVYNDVGLVRFARGQYVLCVLTQGMPVIEDPRVHNPVDEAIARLSRWIFNYLDQA